MNPAKLPLVAQPARTPPLDIAQVFAQGFALHQQGRLAEAAEHYRAVLRQAPRHFDALHLAGVAAHGLGDDLSAEQQIRKALKLNPAYADAWSNLGQALAGQERWLDAIAAYKRAIALQPGHLAALFNRGSALLEVRRPDEALADFGRLVALSPSYAEAHNMRSFTLCRLDRPADAIAAANLALGFKPDFPEAYVNRASALRMTGRHGAAVRDLEQAFAIKPDFDYPFSLYAAEKAMICDWTDLARGKAETFAEIARTIKYESATAWNMLAWSDEPAEISAMAQNTAARLTRGLDKARPLRPARHADGRIRIGYVSSDLGDHPVGQLVSGMLELHDRSRFEIHGFAVQRRSGPMADRLRSSFDHYHDFLKVSDEDAVRLMRKAGIDIAINLNGYTSGDRNRVFARRAAPVQVNFLGFAATMGADFMDYIVVDPVLAPPGSEGAYTEKLVRLPHSYMPSDTTRPISDRPMSRAEHGLPDDGFVFCSFVTNYKIMPDVFAAWMRLLAAVPGSVLWLRKGQDEARDNLRASAAAHGIDPDRLVFAGFADLADHFARYRLADLFLDTFPYGAHTTANDALWAGLPVLSMAGKCYHSRVAASLLHAVGLPELVTSSLAEYEALALALARDPARLGELTTRLREGGDASPLFDMPAWTRAMEAAYTEMARRARAGEAPTHLTIAPQG